MDGKHEPERIDTIVIGAGQAGLSAGYHLARRGVPFVILDADARIGDHWRSAGTRSGCTARPAMTGCPGMRFPASTYHYPSGREMGDYLEAYARRFEPASPERDPRRRGPAGDGRRRLLRDGR